MHRVYSIELLRTPTPQELEVCRASRDLAMRDLAGIKPSGNTSELGKVMLKLSQQFHDLQQRLERQSAYMSSARAERSALREENIRLLAEIETLKMQQAAPVDTQSGRKIEGWTLDDAALQLQTMIRDLGGEPTLEEIESSEKVWGCPSLTVYEAFFGSLSAAISFAKDLTPQ